MSTAAQKPRKGDHIQTMSTEFGWSDVQLGAALGAFYAGYVFLQIPVRWMLRRISAKNLFGLGIIGASIFTMLTPLCAPYYYLLLLARFCCGLAEGVTYPCMAKMVVSWSPVSERTTALSVCSAGAYMGTAAALPSSASFLSNFGWRSVFYVYGVLGLAWAGLWQFIGSATPEKHPWIAAAELVHIQAMRSEGSFKSGGLSSPTGNVQVAREDRRLQNRMLPPGMTWRTFVCHPAARAGICAAFGYCWIFYTMLSEYPSFASSMLGLHVQSAGITAAGPYILLWITTTITGWVSDSLISRGWTSRLIIRKITFVMGMAPASVLIASVGYVESATTAIVLITIAIGIGGIAFSGTWAYVLDVSGKYSALFYATANVAGTIPGFLSPFLVGLCLQFSGERNGWKQSFWVSCSIGLAACVVFCLGAVDTEIVGLEDTDIQDQERDEYLHHILKDEKLPDEASDGLFGNQSTQFEPS